MEKPVPSFLRILDTDYISTFSSASIATVWGLLLIFKVLRLQFRDENFYIIFSAVVTLLAVVAIVWRQLVVRRLFKVGAEARGKIVGVSLYRDRGRFTVEYTPKGERNRVVSKINLHNLQRIRRLKEGDTVTLLVDPQQPNHTLIKETYLES